MWLKTLLLVSVYYIILFIVYNININNLKLNSEIDYSHIIYNDKPFLVENGQHRK